MRITHLWCTCCHNRVPLDHYRSGSCANPPLPIPRLLAIQDRNESDTMHADGRTTATRVIGCPREPLFADFFPNTVNLLKLNAAYEGSREHDDMHKWAPKGFYTECTFPLEGQEPPVLFGLRMFGTCDLVRPDFTRVEDYKKHNAFTQGYKYARHIKGEVGWEDAVQLNIYRTLVAMCVLKIPPAEYRPELVLHHIAMTGSKGAPPYFRIPDRVEEYSIVPIMNETEMGRVKPYGSRYSIQQNADAIRRYHEEVASGVPKEQAIKRVPLAGREMYKGDKCLRYCASERTCNLVEGIRSTSFGGKQ